MKEALLPLLGLLTVVGCASTPPTALESKLFNVQTNYTPTIAVQTNTVWKTNEVVSTIAVTNSVGIPTTIFITNEIPIPLYSSVIVTSQVPSYIYLPGTNQNAIKDVAGTMGDLLAPGVGGSIASGIVGLLFAGWAWIRGSKATAMANNLGQVIEVAREVIKTLPNGANIDTTLTTWMQQHQAEAGVLPAVLDILNNSVDNQAARQTADQLKAAIAALKA